MFIVIYSLVWLAALAVTNLLSFAVGRCGRKLPVIDYGLPWVMHRSAVPPPDDSGVPFGPGTATGEDRWRGQRPAA